MKFFQKYFAILSGLLIFIVYLTTLAPSVVEIDSGELATVQATLGIAHPTGYPLFTMIGYFFSLIPLPFTKIYQLNLLTAIWCSLGAGIFIYTSKLILDNLINFLPSKEIKNEKPANKKKKQQAKEDKSKSMVSSIPEVKKYLAAITGGLILAFSQTYWFQSTSVEVYSLQLFLINLIILSLAKAYLYKDSAEKAFLKNPWFTFAILLALGFSNHMTTLFILPGAAYLYFEKYRFNTVSFKRIGLMLLIFFPVLVLIYSYLPIRASQNPALDWGNPTNLSRILRHISGKQYQVWLFSSTAAAKTQLTHFVDTLPAQFSISLFICFIGLFAAFIRAKKFFIFATITFVFTVLYSINYDIHDIDSYFLLADVMLGFFAVFGTVHLLSILKMERYKYAVPAFLIGIFVLIEVYNNYPDVNQNDTYTFKDYTTGILKSVDKNSVIFSYEWDYFVSASYYFQYVEHLRPDVTVVDKELLRRSWYYHQLNVDHPKLLSGMGDDVSEFLKALAPFESGGAYNSQLLESLYRRIMTDLVSTNIEHKNFYIAPELFDNEMQKGEFSLPAGYTLVPDLFLFKVVKGNQYVSAPDPDFKIRFPSKQNHYTLFIENNIGNMLARRAFYEMQFDKVDRAKLYVKKIKEALPGYKLPKGLAEVLSR